MFDFDAFTQAVARSLLAPIDGIVQLRLAEPGEVLGAGGRVLNLLDLSDVYMTFFLPEMAAGRVALGSEVRIVEFAGSWVRLPVAEQTRLGATGQPARHARLGVDAAVQPARWLDAAFMGTVDLISLDLADSAIAASCQRAERTCVESSTVCAQCR